MNKAWSRLAFCAVWGLTTALGAEDVLEVDLGEGEAQAQATATPAPSGSAAKATVAPTSEAAAPTPEPASPVPSPEAAEAATPTAEPTAAPTAEPTATPGPALDEVRFDGGGRTDEGLMIISPGGASPEDSLESFGIDSPFNWKDRDRRTLKPGGAPDDEALELSAPETSDLLERVQVETGEGGALPTVGDYDQIERAGAVLTVAEYQVDGRISRSAGGGIFAVRGQQVALRMEPGRQIYPGSIYTVFRDVGTLRSSGEDAQDVGMLVRNTGVLKVVRIEGEEVLARVEKQYDPIREGDLVRLRDPERLRYFNSLRQGGTTPPDLKGEIVGVMQPKMVARRGDVVYLNLGRAQGAWPGLRLLLTREAQPTDVQGMRPVRQTGRLGQVELINVTREAAVARVVQAIGEIRVGDKVRFR